MKVEEINKLKIGDVVVCSHSENSTNAKDFSGVVKSIERYSSGGVRIVRTKTDYANWWSIENIYTPERNPEYFV